jgi:hypothetical protein
LLRCIKPSVIICKQLRSSQSKATTMNPITVFLAVACLAVGAGLGVTGHVYLGVLVVIAAIIVATALKRANTGKSSLSFAPENCAASKAPDCS